MSDPWRILSDLGTDAVMTGLWCAVKACVVLAVAALVARTMKRTAAATRHLVWVLGLAGALAVLPLALALPRWRMPVLRAPERPEPAMTSRLVSEGQPPGAQAVMDMPMALNDALAVPPKTSTFPPHVSEGPQVAWPLVVWAAGTFAVLAWGMTGWASTWWMGRKNERITDPSWVEAARAAAERLGTRRGVTLLRGRALAMPLTWGVLRPTLLLPQEADEWPDERRRAVLLHELAHVRRRDCLTHWLGLTTCAAYWFNPLAWWAASRLRAEREQACDDLVLEAGERPSDYAAQLVGVARSLRPARGLAPAAMAMARPSGLETRLLAILDAQRNRRGPARRLAVACLAGVLAVSAALAAVRLVANEPPRPVVSGQVVGPNGKPQEGAEVVVVASWEHVNSSDKVPAAELLGHGRCDEQGRFRIELAGEPNSDEGRVVLFATALNRGLMGRELTDLNATVEPPIQLRSEQPVEVRLVDLQGSPIAGAEVRQASDNLSPAKGGTGLASELPSRDFLPPFYQKWTTDRDGRFTVRGYGPGDPVDLLVRAPGFGKQRLVIKMGGGTSTLALGRAHFVEGRVTLGKSGPPAVGARIVSETMSEKGGIGTLLGDDEATTGRDGRYRIEAVPGASFRLKVFPPREGADGYLMRGAIVNRGDSVTSRADFALPKGVLVRGRVTEAGTGRPVAGALVLHKVPQRNNPNFIRVPGVVFDLYEQNVFTAADGTFRLGIVPGPGYLLVKGPTADYLHDEISTVELAGHFQWPNGRTYPDALRKLSPKPDESPVDVNLELRRGVTVRGRLADSAGQPVREASLVSRWNLSRDGSRNGMTVNHGPKMLHGGRFELRGCDPASSAPVLFLDSEHQRGAAIELSGKQAGADVTVMMKPCGSASVRIVDAQGKPVRAGRSPAHLEVVLTPGASWGEMPMGDPMTCPLFADVIHANVLDWDRYRDLKTDADGRMTFPTLIPGATYRIDALNQREKTDVEFTVEPGEAKDLGDLKIRNLEHAG
jgi:beta-lactamase regulating signal transducer with metallopeptidase domain